METHVTIVTAASGNHFKSVCQFLKSVPISFRMIFYDIGLTTEEASYLKTTFNIIYRVFDFSKYPEHVNLSSPDAGAYAWKPIIINEVYSESNTDVLLWCDSGNLLNSDIHECINIVRKNKIFSGRTSGTILDWTHPTVLMKLNIPSDMLHRSMRNAAFVGILCNDHITRTFVNEWYTHALDKDSILPPGADRSNHRHDQSILTYLYYKYNVPVIDYYIGHSIHNDID